MKIAAVLDLMLNARVRKAINIEDLREMARRHLPRSVFDYIDGGSEGEITLAENCAAFRELMFRPNAAVSSGHYDLSTTILGESLSVPLLLAPIGYSQLINVGGELAAARAAGEAEIGYVLSTMSSHRIEDIRRASKRSVWYQLYLVAGKRIAEYAIVKAKSCGFSAIVVTVDTPIAGLRIRDVRNGARELLGDSVIAKSRYLFDLGRHPRWLYSFLSNGGLPRLTNLAPPGVKPERIQDIVTALTGTAFTWDDFAWLRELWPGPIVVKGILTRSDARRAVAAGASAIVVSNHGGRQLDGVPASLRVLPKIVEAVGKDVQVILDGGVRSGSDVVKAICLGARAVMIGRAYTYGLAVGGEIGVLRAIAILHADIERTMKLLGCSSIADLCPEFLENPVLDSRSCWTSRGSAERSS